MQLTDQCRDRSRTARRNWISAQVHMTQCRVRSSLAVRVLRLAVQHLVSNDQTSGRPGVSDECIRKRLIQIVVSHLMYFPSPRGLGTDAGSVTGHSDFVLIARE